MFEYDTKRIKFIGILTFLLLTFSVVVGNAYKYIPESGNVNSGVETRLEDEAQEQEEDVSENYEEDVAESEKTETISTSNNKKPFEVIEEAEDKNNLPIVKMTGDSDTANNNDVFTRVKEFKKQSNYLEAVNILNDYLKTVDDVEQKSQCYEELAHIYGIERHYGSALVYAQKAYNLYPTTNREVLLARLYYKTGDDERAKKRIDNVLKRDFWADR